jgi:hypothetical protein
MVSRPYQTKVNIMDREELKRLLRNTIALEDAMRIIYRGTDHSALFSFSTYHTYMRKSNDIALKVCKQIGNNVFFDIYDLPKVPGMGDTVHAQQKMYFDSVLGNLALIRSTIENVLEVKKQEIFDLKNFFGTNLRKAVLKDPENEIYIQDTVEQLLIGRGMSKGIDYDREVGRVKVSLKEYKPDFIFPKLNLAFEIKLSKTKAKAKEIIDEINVDIQAYGKLYSQLLFLIYDTGTIRDEDEFKNDLDNADNIQLLIVKH